jgi:hypothetical protein
MYIVVVLNIGDGIFRDTATWSEFKNEEAFRAWYTEKMQTRYRVIAQDITKEEAGALCAEQKKRRAAKLHEVPQA